MKQLDIKYDLENTLTCVIAEWFETGHVPLYKYQENSVRQFGVKEQLDIGNSIMEKSQDTS